MKDDIVQVGVEITPEGGDYTATETLFLTKDGKVVGEDDPNRLTKLVSKGDTLPMARARALGLLDREPVKEAEAKAVAAPPEDKAVKGPAETKAKPVKKAK